MQKALRVYGQVMRLVRRLPKDSRPYYAKFARENFVHYRDVDDNDTQFLDELFLRAYNTPCGFSTRMKLHACHK
uniref:Complex 1 LYR protein domain-containing protein n=1 Tax=Salix viminalis TaxID=40686 RepID=A0A6N2KET9_SALVM